MMRISVLVFVVALALGTLPAEAQLKDLRVVRGDLLNAQLDGKKVQLKLAGVWVPTPPGVGKKVEYQGAEAREFVVDTLRNESFSVRGLSIPRAGKPVQVQVQVGDEPGQDLAVLLADAGLALRASSSELSAQQVKAIRLAEGRARRARLGLHDGGMQKFTKSQKAQRNLGVEVYNPSQLRPSGTNAESTTGDGADTGIDVSLTFSWTIPPQEEPP